MHPVSLVKDQIKSELQQPSEAAQFEAIKKILSQYRGKCFRSFRRQAIRDYRLQLSSGVFEANWLNSLKKAIRNSV